MGRIQTTLTDEQLSQMEALSVFLTLEQIADYLGICRKTLQRIRQANEEIESRYQKGRARGIGKVANSLVKSAIEGNTTAQIFYLKTQAGWKDTTQVDHTSSDGSMTPKSESIYLQNLQAFGSPPPKQIARPEPKRIAKPVKKPAAKKIK